MRREWPGLLIALLLLLSAPAEGQCRKRILVFLDVSGSMRPRDRSAASPFQQSLDAIENLLQQQGFIEENDVLEVVRFGGSARPKDRAQGREEAAALIQKLRANDMSDSTTDFRLFFDALARTLQESTAFNSQVVLLGSDLVHERVDARPNEEDLQDWAATLTERETTRQEIKKSSARTGYVFFVPTPPSGRLPVREKVWEDLLSEFPEAEKVTPTAGQAGLAQKLRAGLLAPPQLTISRNAEDRTRLDFIVTNPNCYPLHLKTLTVQPADGGTPSEPVSFPVGEEEASLGGISSGDEVTRVLTRPIPSGAAWESLGALKGTVETRESRPGETNGTAGSWLKFRTKQGVVERYLLFSPLLRLDIDVQGHTDEPKTYRLSVRPVGQSEETSVLAETKFDSPSSLNARQPTTMRIVVPASRSISGAIESKASFRIAVEGAQLLGEKQDTVEILEDPAADRSNLFLLVASAIGFVAVLISLWRVRSFVARYPQLDPGRRKYIWGGVMCLVSLLPAAANFFHIRLLRHFSPEGVDRAVWVLSVLTLFTSLAFAIHAFQKAWFDRRVLSAQPPLTLARYKRESLLGVWLPVAVGLIVTVSFAAAWFLISPPVSGKLGRETHPPQLQVVSD
jgi:hypothetical protein